MGEGADDAPAQARALQAMGVAEVCITGGDASGALALDWLAGPAAP